LIAAKQNLKVNTFLGTSENAVQTQLWIAMCVSGLPTARVAEVQIEARVVSAADVAVITDEFVRAQESGTPI